MAQVGLQTIWVNYYNITLCNGLIGGGGGVKIIHTT